MADIFLSYASEDRDKARQLAEAIEAHGWSVWWDRTILAGRRFEDVIDEALAAAKCMVVMWSHVSVTKDWVKEEAEDGRERDILVPVIIEPDVPLPRGFRRLQAEDLSEWDGTPSSPAFVLLVSALERVLGQPNASGIEPLSEDGRSAESATLSDATKADKAHERSPPTKIGVEQPSSNVGSQARPQRPTARPHGTLWSVIGIVLLAVAIGVGWTLYQHTNVERDASGDGRSGSETAAVQGTQSAGDRDEESSSQVSTPTPLDPVSTEQAQALADEPPSEALVQNTTASAQSSAPSAMTDIEPDQSSAAPDAPPSELPETAAATTQPGVPLPGDIASEEAAATQSDQATAVGQESPSDLLGQGTAERARANLPAAEMHTGPDQPSADPDASPSELPQTLVVTVEPSTPSPGDMAGMTSAATLSEDASLEQAQPVESGEAAPDLTEEPTQAPPDDANRRAEIEGLLRMAEADLNARRLTRPAGNNAVERFRQVLSIQPDNEAARIGMERVVTAYVALARTALEQEDLAKAAAYLDRGARIGVQADEIARMRERLAQAELQAEAAAAVSSPPAPEIPKAQDQQSALAMVEETQSVPPAMSSRKPAETITLAVFPFKSIVSCFFPVGKEVREAAKDHLQRYNNAELKYSHYSADGLTKPNLGGEDQFWNDNRAHREPRLEAVVEAGAKLGVQGVLMAWYRCKSSDKYDKDTYWVEVHLVDVNKGRVYTAKEGLLDADVATSKVLDAFLAAGPG